MSLDKINKSIKTLQDLLVNEPMMPKKFKISDDIINAINVLQSYQGIIDELRDYQSRGNLEIDGWEDTFYNGIEYSIDVIVNNLED